MKILSCLLITVSLWCAQSQVPQVALEGRLFVLEEVQHFTNICVVVISEPIQMTASVTISTIGGTARAGEDYVDISEQALTFQPDDERKCITLTVFEDEIVEGQETLSVIIRSSMISVGEPRTADVHIIDNSRISIGLVKPVFLVTEGRLVSVCAVIRNGTISRTIAIVIESLPSGTASFEAMNQDYEPHPITVEFDPSNPSSPICADFVIIDDNIPPILAEDDEYFLVSLISNDDVDVIPAESIAKVVIHDNDGATVRLSSSTVFVTEGSSQEPTLVDVCLVLEDFFDGLERDLHFNLSITLLSASEDDFLPQSILTITFLSNSSVSDISCATYTIIGDDLKEDVETFSLSVTPINNVDIIDGDATIFITIEDDGDVNQDCGLPPIIEDGSIEFTSTLNGSFALYSCHEGFTLTGQDNITCLIDTDNILGQWSAEPPVCIAVDCGVPPSPVNGQVTFTDTIFGSTASYTCDSDCFELLPHTITRTCLSNHTWSGEDPQCYLVECGAPAEIEGCVLTIMPISFECGSEAVYEALPGFTLHGDESVTCRDDSEWQGESNSGYPQCDVSQCPFLPDPECGSVELNSLLVGSTAIFSCDVGCKLSHPNNSQITCMSNEEWSSQPPTCEVVTCPQLSNPPNGTIINDTLSPQPYGTIVNITCDDGFRREGSDSRMCRSDGTWSGEDTNCTFVICEVEVPENGNASVLEAGLGSVVEYTCNTGYHLVGISQQTCLENDTFSDATPTCELIDCGKPLADDFSGTVNFFNTTYGSLANYTCPGDCSSNNISCLDDGNWTELNLTCYMCPPLNSPQNGIVGYHNNSRFPGSYAIYTCNNDFIVTYPNIRNCTCDGWTENEPICEVSPGPDSTNRNDTVIIVSAAIGGSVLLLALILCCVVIWCCLIKNNPKRVHLRRARHNNYKGNSQYVLPYTIYANRSSALEPLASNNRNSTLSDFSPPKDSENISSLRSTESGYLGDQRKSSLFPSVRGSEFGTRSDSKRKPLSARGSNFGVKRQMSSRGSPSNSLAETNTWSKSWAESSLSMNPTSDRQFYTESGTATDDNDDTSSVLTTSTMPMSEYQRRVQAADEKIVPAKQPVSILKKK